MRKEDIELRSEEVQDVLSRMPHYLIRWGNVIIFLLLLVLLLISGIVKYPEIISAEMLITTESPPENLIARASGKIEGILVGNNQKVAVGDPLAVIRSTADYRDVFELSQITAGIDISQSDFVFPFEGLSAMNLGEIEESFVAFEKDYVALELNRELKPHSMEGYSIDAEYVELVERQSILAQQKELAVKERELKIKELERYRNLFQKGVISQQEWESKNMDYLQVEKELKNINSSISQMKSSLNDLDRNRKTNRIDENREGKSLYRNAVQSFNQMKKAIIDWDRSYVMRSSISGEVSFMRVWSKNQYIEEGENVFSIIPDGTGEYVGKVIAKAFNSGKIKEGQNVIIRLASYPDYEFGVVQGTVKTISMIPDKDGNFHIDVSLPRGLATSYGKKIVFHDSMTGMADIVTDDLSLIERLLYQFRGIFSR